MTITFPFVLEIKLILFKPVLKYLTKYTGIFHQCHILTETGGAAYQPPKDASGTPLVGL